ncbi:MAG: hypothetical protein KZQ85_11045 [Candidatus Thiodiazotropha sp. (ex Myrtea sp. 'scaly one' KF741663)]|nr:hypothetical protein [Candidatus Thiodiazotropha sp. (ex Myrtea sp. 'scaly one' KF741663)]
MKQLKRVILVQFYLHEAVDIEIDGSTAFLGPNGSGKSSTLDAIQIAILGGNQRFARFNTQSVSSKQRRTLASYCLGVIRKPQKNSQIEGRARDEARTYIILVFSDGTDVGTVSAGICIEADGDTEQHEVKGLFVLPGQDLRAENCVVLDGNDKRPMPYPEFRETARQRAKEVGRTAILTDKSSEYVSELLYALNGERMPNAQRFMSAFVKSMTLKNVDSIDDFVRNYVVEPSPVDIGAFQKQVEQFAALQSLVEKTNARISALIGILADFERAKSAERRIATLSAIAAIFNVEWLGEQIDTLQEQIELLNEQRKTALAYAQQAKADRDSKQNEVTDLKVRLGTDEVELQRLRLEEQITSRRELINAYQHPEILRANRLINALRDLLDDDGFSAVRKTMVGATEKLAGARSEETPGTSVVIALREIDTNLAPVRSATAAQLEDAVRARNTLADEQEATGLRITAAKQTGRLLGGEAARLLELLSRAGITAQPVSALTSITDSEWAPALERYLGNDRDALVVIKGNTRDAVKILREARRKGLPVNGAAIVQPNHLRKVDTSSKDREFVVGVIEAVNDTARRFLWNKFGNMRLVETEEELETYSRAITRDGMLSQGGLTKSIGVAPVSDLRIGKSIEDTSELARHLAELQGQLASVNKRIARLEELHTILTAKNKDGDDSAAAKLADAARDIKDAEHQLAGLDLSHQDAMRDALKQAEEAHKRIDDEYTKNESLAAALEQQATDRTAEKAQHEARMPTALDGEKAATASPLVDAVLLDELKDEIERADPVYPNRLAEVEKKLNNNRSRLKSAEERASIDLSKYVQEERLDVQIKDMEWHERYHWATEEKTKLADTQLHKYKEEAEQARKASEETLRSDIAMSLHDRFNEMKLETLERNRILADCPEFTGGEKYKFIYTEVPEYEELIKHIESAAEEGPNYSLLSDESGDISETLRSLVEAAAASGDAGAAVDYRQFYTFDLEILVNGKRADLMSSRQGAGSNGEHIAPMYIAAGAALAKAYRLRGRKGQRNGTGLICLDEAFHGMDTTNAVATAKFLQKIGLQLIMAGPELERTKLAPITQTIYDLDKEGLDLLMERTLLKPAANRLMVSDMPGENPEVLTAAYQQLGLEMPPKEPLTEETTQ